MEICFSDSIERGHESTPTTFGYQLDYAFNHLEMTDSRAVSLLFPVDLADHRLDSWPPFLLDLMPTGAARHRLCHFMGIPDNASADLELLLKAGGAPPGNLRIQQVAPNGELDKHPGFLRREVVQRAEGFIAYCLENGSPEPATGTDLRKQVSPDGQKLPKNLRGMTGNLKR